MKKIIIGICVLALLPCLGWAEELTGRDIALKMDAVDTSMDSKRTAIMVINRKGQKLIRKMGSFTKKYGPDERGLIKFIEPPDVRGIMYLTWGYEDIKRDDDMWIFLPAESLVRRISGGGKKGSATRHTGSTLQKALKRATVRGELAVKPDLLFSIDSLDPFSPTFISTCNSLRILSKTVKNPLPQDAIPMASHLTSATNSLTTI